MQLSMRAQNINVGYNNYACVQVIVVASILLLGYVFSPSVISEYLLFLKPGAGFSILNFQ